MQEIAEYLQEKLDRMADRILEILTGSKGYKVRKVKERVPRVVPARVMHPVAHPDDPCGKY